MDAHQTQGCIVQQMDAYMGFAGLKTVKKAHCHSVLFCFFSMVFSMFFFVFGLLLRCFSRGFSRVLEKVKEGKGGGTGEEAKRSFFVFFFNILLQ